VRKSEGGKGRRPRRKREDGEDSPRRKRENGEGRRPGRKWEAGDSGVAGVDCSARGRH
jgi:hypothetical protein